MNTYGRLLTYVRPYKTKLIIAFLCTFAYSLSHSAVSAVVYVMVKGFYGGEKIVIDNLPQLDFLKNLSFPSHYIPLIVCVMFLKRFI